MKTCTKCGHTKPLDAFPPRKDHSRDGLHTECRDCRRTYSREYMRQRRLANPEAEREAQRRWRESNPDAGKAKDLRYKAANRELLRERARRRRLENPRRVRDSYQRWRTQHREQELLRLTTRRALTTSDSVLKEFIAALLDQPCDYCGGTDNITVDHVVPLSRGGSHEPANLAPACLSCNSSKGDRLLSEWPGRFAA